MSEHPAEGVPEQADAPLTADVCIVGAGIAGLNAAFVASQYLRPDQTVLVIERRAQASGMWNDAYSYVRLHQPYEVFTAGDIAWTLGREPAYLAARDEVVAHLKHCLEVISTRVTLDARWGWEYVAHRESGDAVYVEVRDGDGRTRRVVAGRLIKAVGYGIEANPALPLSSTQVRSVSPEVVADRGLLDRGDGTPVWVIGSGKTAMDTAHALIKAGGRPVNMVAGSGTFFFSRDIAFPTGARRWVAGRGVNRILADLASRFDGTNGEEVTDGFLRDFGVSPLPQPIHNLFGVLSTTENDVIRAGLSQAVPGHLEDVVDEAGAPVMLLRGGDRIELVPGSWIINCTGYLPAREVDYEPYSSPSGRVLSINSASLVLGFTSFSAYFLSHLMFRDRLTDTPLYAIDYDDARRKQPRALAGVGSALFQHNLSVLFETLGPRPFMSCGLDFDRWYPLPRRLAGQLRFMRTHRRNRPQLARALDVFADTTGVRCGPIHRDKVAVEPAVSR